MWDVACFGELFIDLVPQARVNGQWLLGPSPGGAPGNVAAGLARLGHKSLMLSRVGDEAFGRLILAALKSYGVDISGVTLSLTEKTGLSVVTLGDSGERDFMFYHDHPADLHINPDDITPDQITQSRILHFGLLPLSAPQSAAAQLKAMDIADEANCLLSCDVNFRPGLWADHSKMLDAGRLIVSRSSIVKASEEELSALGKGSNMDAMVRALWHDKLQLFSVTKGEVGAVLYTQDSKYVCEGFEVDAVDTTGAGDAYTASILSGVLKDGVAANPSELVRNACAAGALAAIKKGAMESLPEGSEVSKLVDKLRVAVSVHPCS